MADTTDQVTDKSTSQQVRHTAVKLLARREHSCLELQQKLKQRGYPNDLIQQELEKLMAKGVLSDQRFAESYIRARSQKGYGPQRIISELQQRGIDSTIGYEYIEQMEKDWLQLAEQIRSKKFGKKLPQDFAEKAKQMRFLQYRGFAITHINAIFK